MEFTLLTNEIPSKYITLFNIICTINRTNVGYLLDVCKRSFIIDNNLLTPFYNFVLSIK